MSRPLANRRPLVQSIVCAFIAAGILSPPTRARADEPESYAPTGLMFVGLQRERWVLLLGNDSLTPRTVSTVSEPRTPAYSRTQHRVAYISAEGAVREVDLRSGTDSVLLEPTRSQSYTQLAYRPGSAQLYLVVLRDGSSIETDLAVIDRNKRQARIVSRQRSAQFEPTFSSDGAQLVYSNVSCASECPNIIQEIWSMDLVSAVARQLTLLNAVSRQPFVERNGSIVFVSNERGHYQLWRVAPGAAPVRLTSAAAIDESPVSSDRGEIFFVRRTPKGSELARRDASGVVTTVVLDRGIRDVRDLRWGS